MKTTIQDLRYALRVMLKNSGFTAIAVMALALGIGANTAIFSVVNAVLFRPLPFPTPERLVMVWDDVPRLKMDHVPASPSEFIDWRNQTQMLENIAAFRNQFWNLASTSQPERIDGAQVAANFFSTLGVQPILGRAFSPEEERAGANRVVTLSYNLWQRRFNSDPNIVEKTIALNGQDYTVIGVMPQGFRFPSGANLPSGLGFSERTEMWEPLALTDQQIANRNTHNLAVVGRIKPSVSLQQAQAEMDSISNRMQEQYPRSNQGISARLFSLREQIVGDIRPLLFVLLGTVGLVLLIACANVANLLLALATSRRKEMAIRTALGAGRARLVRQLLTESLLLSLVGGGLGLVLAFWGIDVLAALIPSSVPRANEITVDSRMLLFTLVVSLATGFLFGLIPAAQASKADFHETLKEGARGATSGSGRNRLRSLLVVSQVAIAVMLLIGAGLLIRSFWKLQQVNQGFDATQVLTMEIALPTTPPSTYTRPEQQAAFFRQALERLHSQPGVESAAVVSSLPLSGLWENTGFKVDTQPVANPTELPRADFIMVSADYFNVMKIPLQQGRFFTEQDNADSPGVVIISAALANRYYAGENPVGKQLITGLVNGSSEIIGVVGDVKQTTLDAEIKPAFYIPYQQFPYPGYTLVARPASEPAVVIEAVRGAVHSLDSSLPITNIRAMEQVVSKSVSQRRFNMLLLGLFAALAVILAGVGLYGVIAYVVAQRTHEIGIRMALGAQSGDVLRMIIRQGMTLTLIGVSVGLLGAFALTRVLSTLLYGVSTIDPITFIAVSLFLTGVALIACFAPSYKASRTDPIIALRYE